ncbi:MAG: hypothetical protein Q8914_02805 [Bacteroidota bacterium]|nr:hypothetical protein [Bacteroidota bacterium]
MSTKQSTSPVASKTAGTKGNKAMSGKVSGEIYAAISAALYDLDNEVHDIETGVLTITRKSQFYSPWNSRIQGMRQLPIRK